MALTKIGILRDFLSTGIDDNATSLALTINSSGSVGIGESVPQRMLHISGTVPAVRLEDTDRAGDYFDIISLSDGTWRVRADQGNASGATATSMVFDVDGAEAMRIDSSGNVGIGAAPNALLDVSSVSTSTIRLSNSDTGLTLDQITGQIEFYQADATADGTGITGKIGMRSVTQTGGGTYYGNVADMAFYVSGQVNGYASDNATLNAMTIRAGNGNVGINDTAPDAKLTIADAATASTDPTDPTHATISLQYTSTKILNIGDYAATPFASYIQSTNTSGTPFALALNPSGGRVGIGTNSPSGVLAVTDGANGLIVGQSGENFYSGNTHRFYSQNYTTEHMHINASGNVGIGTTSPASALSIEGSSTGEFDALILRNSNAATSGQSTAMIFEVSAGTIGDEASSAAKISALRTGSGTTGDLLFHTTNAGVSAERMRISNDGTVSGLWNDNTTHNASGKFVKMTQAQYNAITPDSNTIYFIT